MQNELALFRKKFQLDDLTLVENDHWVLSIRPQQLTLGSMVLSVKHEVYDFSSLSEDQSLHMAELLGVAEKLVKARWGAVRLNVLCLMMQDPLLHFHIFPRYDRTVEFAGREWKDADWPKPPSVVPTDILADVNAAIYRELVQ
ncbi:HIT family protein [Nitrincola schmidtii]|uniref:HIT family protein n=1 Tax=Nitrincola schmidtii TaxID=1730894 RepID=UPI00124DDCBA|nr:HIT family protein [Nitrincola schmidtii]